MAVPSIYSLEYTQAYHMGICQSFKEVNSHPCHIMKKQHHVVQAGNPVPVSAGLPGGGIMVCQPFLFTTRDRVF
jgi:hypothetical protein